MSRGSSRVRHALLAGVVAVALWPASAAGQAVTGTISGTVVDQQGSVIPGATVTIINEATSDTRVVVTDGRGDFQVTNLQPGTYTARVELESFRTRRSMPRTSSSTARRLRSPGTASTRTAPTSAAPCPA